MDQPTPWLHDSEQLNTRLDDFLTELELEHIVLALPYLERAIALGEIPTGPFEALAESRRIGRPVEGLEVPEEYREFVLRWIHGEFSVLG